VETEPARPARSGSAGQAGVVAARDGYEISRDSARLDRALIHRFLSEESYWSPGISRSLVDRAIDGSLPFGLYRKPAVPGPNAPGPAAPGPTAPGPPGSGSAGSEQVGFGRVVTDGVYLGYLADVFVVEPHRRRGLARWLVATILAAPDLSDVRWWLLGTADAHGLYAPLGFAGLRRPERLMEIRRHFGGPRGQRPAQAGAHRRTV
jgi:GNAT superfamily N-acetyltransferase